MVFNSIHYHDKGDLTKYGLKDYTIFYHVHIWSKEIRKKERMPAAPPTDKRLAKLVKNIPSTKSPAIFDIEHWPLDIRRGVKIAADDDIASANAKKDSVWNSDREWWQETIKFLKRIKNK